MLKKLVAAIVMTIATMLLVGAVQADPNITITSNIPEGSNMNLEYGQEVVLTAHLTGYEDCPYTYHIQWMYSTDNVTWNNIKGATGNTYTFILSPENDGYSWQAKVVIDGMAQTGTRSSTQTTKKTTVVQSNTNILDIFAWIAAGIGIIIVIIVILYFIVKADGQRTAVKEQAKEELRWNNLTKEQQLDEIERKHRAEQAKLDWLYEHADEIAAEMAERKIRAAEEGARQAAYDNARDRADAIREQTEELRRQANEAAYREERRKANLDQAADWYGRQTGMGYAERQAYRDLMKNF